MNKEKCKLLSLDTSTKSTGFALYESGKLRHYDVLNLSKIKDTNERIKLMILKIFEIIKKYDPQIIVTEMTVVTRNAEGQRNLTMILGSIFGQCLIDDITYYSLRPTEWRKLVKDKEEKLPRKREELKVWSKQKVESIFGITDINDDVSDAILLGQSYINRFSE